MASERGLSGLLGRNASSRLLGHHESTRIDSWGNTCLLPYSTGRANSPRSLLPMVPYEVALVGTVCYFPLPHQHQPPSPYRIIKQTYNIVFPSHSAPNSAPRRSAPTILKACFIIAHTPECSINSQSPAPLWHMLPTFIRNGCGALARTSTLPASTRHRRRFHLTASRSLALAALRLPGCLSTQQARPCILGGTLCILGDSAHAHLSPGLLFFTAYTWVAPARTQWCQFPTKHCAAPQAD